VPYVPDRGHAVWLSFDPQLGHEQAGRRPALVISPASYNGKVGLAVFCPITNRIKGYPFEVGIPRECGVTGVVLSDQVKSLDWIERKAEFIGEVPNSVMNEVLAKLHTLVAGDVDPR
jgi:mRNA interferase MazF